MKEFYKFIEINILLQKIFILNFCCIYRDDKLMGMPLYLFNMLF